MANESKSAIQKARDYLRGGHPQCPQALVAELLEHIDGCALTRPREQFDLVAHLGRQIEWSLRTFGPGARPTATLDHIRKELGEIESDPADLVEWIDVVLLALDGAWRAGYSATEVTLAIALKQIENEGRTWPDWRSAEPGKAIEHERAAG